MSATLTALNEDPLRPVRRAITRLFDFGHDLLERLVGARKFCVTTYIPRRMARDVPGAQARVTRALYWLAALSRTIAGRDDYFLLPSNPLAPARRARLTPARPRDPCPALNPPFTDDDADNPALLARIRRTFATVPTCVIARGIARRLGIRQDSDSWPRDLLAITETPAAFAERTHYIYDAPSADPVEPDLLASPPDLIPNPTPPPPFHPRE